MYTYTENGKELWNGLYIQACKKYSLHLLKADHILLGLKRTFLADAGFALNLDRHSLYLKLLYDKLWTCENEKNIESIFNVIFVVLI